MERFIPLEIFRKKVMASELPFSRFYRNDGNFLYHPPWCFANSTAVTHSDFRKRFQVQYHLSEIFYRNSPTNGKLLWKGSNPRGRGERSLVYEASILFWREISPPKLGR